MLRLRKPPVNVTVNVNDIARQIVYLDIAKQQIGKNLQFYLLSIKLSYMQKCVYEECNKH